MSETGTKEIKFLDTGKYAEHKPYMPQLEVKEVGEEHTVSREMAESLVDAGKAEYCAAQLADGPGDEMTDDEKEAAEVVPEPPTVDAETLALAESLGNKNHGKNRKSGKRK